MLHQQQIQLMQQQQQHCLEQQQYGHNGVYGQYQVSAAQKANQVHQVAEVEDPYAFHQGHPVVSEDPYAFHPGHQVLSEEPYAYHPGHPVVLREPEPTYVDPGRMRENKVKRPPPPPRRSQDTQLSNHGV